MIRLRSLLRRFGRNRSGAIALLFGLLIIPTILVVGVFVDYARAIIARERLQSAIDAAALAVGASAEKELSDEEVKALAQSYFDANFPPEERDWVGPLDVDVDGARVTIAAEGKVDTTLMRVANFVEMDIAANTEVTREQKKLEIVMALDNTGSMGGSKLTSLKDASKGLVNILFGEEDESDFIKIGLVPFAAAVNVGTDKLDEGWIDLGVGTRSSVHDEDFTSTLTSLFSLYDAMDNSDARAAWRGCVRARPAPYDGDDTPPDAGTPDTLFVPYLAPDEPDDPPYGGYVNNYMADKFGAAAGGEKEKDKKAKDKKEKDKDKDKDGGSTTDICLQNDTADHRQRCIHKYYGATFTNLGNKGPHYNCANRPVLALTNDRDMIDTQLDAMVANGSTVVPEGLAWAWRVISPAEPFTEGEAYDAGGAKAIVLLTDGQNDVGNVSGNPTNGHNGSNYNAFGFAAEGHLGRADGADSTQILNQKLAALCTKVKAEGIRLYTITFQVSNTGIQDLMRACATEPSMYYNSPSGGDLENVFADIAKGLQKLRISK